MLVRSVIPGIMAEEKKLSFVFSKVSKPSGLLRHVKSKSKEEVQYIDCLDSKTIVFKKSEDEGEKITDLVIPLNKSTHDKPHAKSKKGEWRQDIHTAEISTDTDGGDSLSKNSLEETAVREILEDVKKTTEVVKSSHTSALQIQSRHGIGEPEEPTLEDYECIPVADFGMAMLKGMGWNPKEGIGKKGRIVTPYVPKPRPRGMGLGADEVRSSSVPSSVSKEEGEELKVIKGAFVQIISGSQRGQYGQIEGFSEDCGRRVIVRLSFHSSAVTINEKAFKLVTKEEYSKNSRVLNASKYEEYKQKIGVNHEVAIHNTCRGEKRCHKSQRSTNKKKN